MNENLEASQGPVPALAGNIIAAEIPSPRRAAAYWLKRFLACNPFYLVSAARFLAFIASRLIPAF